MMFDDRAEPADAARFQPLQFAETGDAMPATANAALVGFAPEFDGPILLL
jgi:hypothetical protein